MIVHTYDLDIYHHIPLVYASILSESSDYFYTATRRMMSQEKEVWSTPDIVKLAKKLYDSIWDLKEKDWAKKKANKDLKLDIGQRHASSVNIKGSEEGLERSIELMCRMHHACSNLDDQQLNDMHYFVKALSIFSNTKKGIMHAGDLLSQHVLVIGACVGVFPIQFATYGELGDTKCRDSLSSRFNLFQGKDKDNFSTDSATILKALSYLTNESLMYCENLVCKEMQTSVTGSATRWAES